MLEGFPPTKTQHLFISVLEEKEVHAKLLQSCPTLCYLTDCGPPGSSVHGILQARILEWGAFPPPGHLPDPGIEPVSLCLLCWQVGSLPPAGIFSATCMDFLPMLLPDLYSGAVFSPEPSPHLWLSPTLVD